MLSLLSLFAIIAVVLALYFYKCSCKYKKKYSELNINNNKQLIESSLSDNGVSSCLDFSKSKELSDLAFKAQVVSKSGKVAFWDYDVKNDVFIYANNDNNIHFNGLSWDDYIKLIYPDDVTILETALSLLLNGEQDTMEITYRLKLLGTDEYRWFDIIAVVYDRDENGYPLLISGARWDVTSNIIEKQKLEESKTFMEFAFSASGLLSWELDLDTGKLSSSDKLSDVHNGDYTFETYTNKLVHPDHRDRFLECNIRFFNGDDSVIDTKVKVINNGRYEWVHIIGRIISDSSIGLRKAVGTSQIITEIIEKQEELVRLRNKAEESNNLKSAFLANMSHEIRTPLNAIVGFSNLIVDMSGNDEIREYCRIIEVNNNILQQLVTDILDISRIEAGQMEFNFNDIDIREIFCDLKTIYEHKIPKGVQLICDIPEQKCVVFTERNRLVQVVSNIINNAIKYTSEGSITIGYADEDKYIRFYIIDTGKGISENNIPKLFDRFSKFDSNVPGIGLGLSICEMIVQRLGGQITVSSELGKGSEFSFTISKKGA